MLEDAGLVLDEIVCCDWTPALTRRSCTRVNSLEDP